MKLTSQITVISPTQYENQLLRQRNQLLAQENHQLLCQVENLQFQLKSIKDSYAQKLSQTISQQTSGIYQLVNAKLLQIETKVQRVKDPYLQAKLKIISQLVQSQSSVKSIVKCCLEFIEDLTKDQENRKSQNKLGKVADLLNRRKNSYNQIKQTKIQNVHFIKEPPKVNQSISTIMEPIHNFYQHLVRKVKKEHMTSQKINSIFNQISDYAEYKENQRNQTLKVMKLEREWELGLTSDIQFTEYSKQISERNGDLNQLRERILIKIASLN